jgi:multisubunit Na+/H+ antiporter MnhG subunit
VTARLLLECGLLGVVVLSCWLGALGMLLLRDPTQALHYLSLPSSIGAPALAAAIFAGVGPNQAAGKMLLLTLVLFTTNAVVTHATARAFRARALGHWEPRDGDPLEFIPAEPGVPDEAS